MPQTFGIIYLHVIFSTKGREPFLAGSTIQNRMHTYLAGALARMDCPALCVGGGFDHVHILMRLSRDKAASGVIRELKKASSQWAKRQGGNIAAKFAWQKGYAAFSVSLSGVPHTRRYIERQNEHHQKVTFKEELRAFLRRHAAEFDERYIWD